MNIYVGNLPLTLTEDELKGMFSEYGQVFSAKLILDRDTNQSRGFGFVEMSENVGRKAIAELNETEYNGRQIIVNEARPRDNTRRGGGNFNRRRSW